MAAGRWQRRSGVAAAGSGTEDGDAEGNGEDSEEEYWAQFGGGPGSGMKSNPARAQKLYEVRHLVRVLFVLSRINESTLFPLARSPHIRFSCVPFYRTI